MKHYLLFKTLKYRSKTMTKTEMIQYIDKEIEIILNMIQKKD